ncbi:cell division protein FtsQ/DivIB [Streptococcus macacae]|uniref:Cell division protein DivIB n=1 Tax=Streptococcus macacae NCTC 11558 TaxID=764298 RepID=G5JVZ8_9STRE|nr:FtsQ-type POTRA domain-containing protein [Streptococcus macacae]EHJ51868.1 POTRA domain protein, FtsQ-type [Streptococcus macacae NCTC 11558]SUN78991.1 cell division protein [Streptococcus macacae NCTC 11558]
MAKDKDRDKEKQENKETASLTQWQQRNLEFLKKRQEEKLEKEKKEEQRMAEKKAQFQAEKETDKPVKKVTETTDEKSAKEAKEESFKSIAQTKKKKVKKKKKAPVIPRKELWQALLIIIISSFVLMASLFMISPFSRQKTVSVSGSKNAIEAEIIEKSGIKKSDYLTHLIFNRKHYEKAIEQKDNWIKKARIDYRFPNKFTIKVKEYNILAYTQTDKGYIPILENGTRVDTVNASELPESFLKINLDDKEAVRRLVQKLAKVDKAIVEQIKTISSANSRSTKDLLLLEMKDGYTIRVPLSDIDTKLPYYPKIKKDKADGSIIDMEVGLYSTSPEIEAKLDDNRSKANSESSNNSTTPDKENTSSDADSSQSSSDAVTEATTSQ